MSLPTNCEYLIIGAGIHAWIPAPIIKYSQLVGKLIIFITSFNYYFVFEPWKKHISFHIMEQNFV